MTVTRCPPPERAGTPGASRPLDAPAWRRRRWSRSSLPPCWSPAEQSPLPPRLTTGRYSGSTVKTRQRSAPPVVCSPGAVVWHDRAVSRASCPHRGNLREWTKVQSPAIQLAVGGGTTRCPTENLTSPTKPHSSSRTRMRPPRNEHVTSRRVETRAGSGLHWQELAELGSDARGTIVFSRRSGPATVVRQTSLREQEKCDPITRRRRQS